MLFFHGTGGSGTQPWLLNLGTRRNVITVFPQGMGDTYDGSQAWNVPNKPNDTSFCMPDTEITACYDSCQKLNLCTVCSWTTCYNDVEFVDALMEYLNENLCLNSSDIHISGSSNGAMFVYYLTSQRPNYFKGYQVLYGAPNFGYLNTSMEMRDKHILVMHGREDKIIPPAGGLTMYRYIVEPEDNMLGQWAVI